MNVDDHPIPTEVKNDDSDVVRHEHSAEQQWRVRDTDCFWHVLFTRAVTASQDIRRCLPPLVKPYSRYTNGFRIVNTRHAILVVLVVRRRLGAHAFGMMCTVLSVGPNRAAVGEITVGAAECTGASPSSAKH